MRRHSIEAVVIVVLARIDGLDRAVRHLVGSHLGRTIEPSGHVLEVRIGLMMNTRSPPALPGDGQARGATLRRVELTHVELSVAPGSLDLRFEADLDRLLHDVFGWVGATSVDNVPDIGPSKSRTYIVSSHVRLVLREQPIAMTAGADDHLGFLVGSAELDELVERTVALASSDDRLELRHVRNGRPSSVAGGAFVFRTFFVRFLLPVWFQFESYESSSDGD